MTLISKTDELVDFCRKLENEEFITVDLEFIREKTYWAKLCLIQIAGEHINACIDAISPDISLEPFFDLMQNERILKVFHAGSQDLEIIYCLSSKIPTPIFDTQIAAMVCGYGESVGYQTLVHEILKIDIDKSMRFSDWSTRPLNKKQIDYALSDVTHLREIYKTLDSSLKSNNRENWLKEELEHLCNPETYTPHPYEEWRKLKHRSSNRKFLTILREVTAWRENEAIKSDRPRRRVMKDECLLDIAANAPRSPKELERTRSISADMARGRYGKELLEAVEKALNLSKDEWVNPIKPVTVPKGKSALVDILRLLLKIQSDNNNVAQKLIGSNDDLVQIILDPENTQCSLLKGWRHDIFGQYALKFIAGESAFIFNPETRRTEIVDYKKS